MSVAEVEVAEEWVVEETLQYYILVACGSGVVNTSKAVCLAGSNSGVGGDERWEILNNIRLRDIFLFPFPGCNIRSATGASPVPGTKNATYAKNCGRRSCSTGVPPEWGPRRCHHTSGNTVCQPWNQHLEVGG